MKTKIQELRKVNKVSQAELADELNVTRQTIISLEKGRYNASLELAYKIAKYFGKTIEEVFLFEEELGEILCQKKMGLLNVLLWFVQVRVV